MNNKKTNTVKLYNPSKEVEKAISHIKKQQKIINWAMVAIIVVVSLGFISIIISTFTIFIDYHKYTAQKFDDYTALE